MHTVDDTAAIELNDVVVLLGRFPALAGIDLTVSAGTLTLLQGPNGAGKTTLLRCLAGLVPVARGSGTVLGLDITAQQRDIRREVGLAGHRTGLYADLTARENLAFLGRINRVAQDDVDASAERLGLGERVLDTAAGRLSAGQRRRTALAGLVLRRPRLWLLDEPHAGLDQAGRAIVDDLLSDAVSAGATVLIASHELERTRGLAARTVTLGAGAVHSDVSAVDGVER